MSLTVSVVIPTFNRRGLLERALSSVFRQTLPPDEVIVVDDGSTDRSNAMVERRFPQVRLIRRESQGGVSAARNRGVTDALSSWIAFLDSDDEWHPAKLERQMAALRDQPSFRLCHCDEIWIRNGVRVNPGHRHEKRGGWIFDRCLPLCAISPSAAVVHKASLAEVGPFDEDLPACEDYDLWLRWTSRHPVLYVNEQLVIKHGGRPDQLSRSTQALDRYRIRALLKLLQEGHLGQENRAAAKATLLEKIQIYSSGADKRGRREEAAELRACAAAL